MIYRLYNIKQNRYAEFDQYVFLSVDRCGSVVEVLPESGCLTRTNQWKVQYGFIHSNGRCYYQNDQHMGDNTIKTIELRGGSFYIHIKSNSTFYDVNYGGQRYDIGIYPITPQTKLW